MEESLDVKALRARFNNQAGSVDTSSRDSGSPKSPQPKFGKLNLPLKESQLAQKLPPPGPLPLPGLARYPRADSMAESTPFRPGSIPRQHPPPLIRSAVQSVEPNKVKQAGEILQNLMLKHQKPPSGQTVLGLAKIPPQESRVSPTPTPSTARQRSTGEVTPLRRPLPPEAPLPLKPKRPPKVNLEPFLKSRQGTGLPLPRRNNGTDVSLDGKISLPGTSYPPSPPERSLKPKRLPHQAASIDIQDTYDDIGVCDLTETCSDNSMQGGDNDSVYEFIDDDQVDANMKRHQEKEMRQQLEHQLSMKDLRRNFQLHGEIEVLHTARVRHDWRGEGTLDLSVQQGQTVEIIRVTDNPGGRWLVRSLSGAYGYISNTCVDVDMKKNELMDLPPPPPDPPQLMNMNFTKSDSLIQEDSEYEDDYDDVLPVPDDFPPPPLPKISIDPKLEKELRKKFKYDGPFRVLHCMMVDPNCIIKKPGAKELPVTQGEVLDIIQDTNNKKCLCRSRSGNYGYVPKALLLPMEGDIYDDVEYPDEVYDNDASNLGY